MKPATFEKMYLFTLIFLAHWFFGNLYEQIVLAPNQLVNTFQQLQCWQAYFTITNQIYYYVPFTQVAVLVVGVLHYACKIQPQKSLLRKAMVFGLLAIAITVAIVTQLNVKIFFGDLDKLKSELFTLSVLWIFGNAVRLYFVGSALYFTFRAYLHHRESVYVGHPNQPV